MRSLMAYGPGDVRLETVPVPGCGPEEVLVRVRAVGVCRTDLEVIGGRHGALLRGVSRYPLVPGHEWAGEVVACGERVSHLRVGELVVGETGIGCLQCRVCLSGHHNLCPQGTETGIVGRDGAMREYHVQRAAFVHPCPALDPHLAALIEPASVGVYACHRVQVSPLDRVAIVGAGSIGLLCLQAALACGARQVVMVSRSGPKLQLAQQLGATATLDNTTGDVLPEARELTAGDLFDVVLEAAGTPASLTLSLALGAYAGRVAVVGYASPEPYGHSLETVIDREQTIVGVRGSPLVYPQTIEMVRRGSLQLEPLVTHRYPLEDFATALKVADEGGPEVIKVLLLP